MLYLVYTSVFHRVLITVLMLRAIDRSAPSADRACAIERVIGRATIDGSRNNRRIALRYRWMQIQAPSFVVAAPSTEGAAPSADGAALAIDVCAFFPVLIIICLVLRTKRDVPLSEESILNVEMKLVNSNFISLFLHTQLGCWSEVRVIFYLYKFSQQMDDITLKVHRFYCVVMNRFHVVHARYV